MDVKEILGLPQISFPVQEKNSQSQRKPDAISQEVLFHGTTFHLFFCILGFNQFNLIFCGVA
jgi:hypothetical protein